MVTHDTSQPSALGTTPATRIQPIWFPGRREATIAFGCDPANVEKLRDAALSVLRAVQKDGISDEYLAKVREQLKRARETDAKDNRWWTGQLRDAYWFGDDFGSATTLEPVPGTVEAPDGRQLSVADVLTEAGVSRASFYFYFASKYALLERLAERVTGSVFGTTRAWFHADDGHPRSPPRRAVGGCFRGCISV